MRFCDLRERHEARKAERTNQEQLKDICTLKQRNNSKDVTRTAEQIEQSKQARANHYLAKWTKMLEAAETQTQKIICKNMLYGLKY